ncbi:MAG: STAS domain-containing protein [Candidatus Cloacimonadales bacterium]|jgi:anti-sigma B factor antagonist|nr:STAS domain-containing protein [Candidatus Cloacimonadota bacterium]MDY0380788.1 STAS domain-containing protein [Candidatus Cloacimonadaceae bacterium]HCM15997.1 anti-sigma factor antagonist [Candidatus Cloacimonas sp.]MCB5256232.1 STAS domain-containing protein [Candidatus Cloacimonadota bacterium]MCB5264292.1 STAS domain-containing protein [Candidatus Cloacimonadota bacterium]
MQLIFKQQNDVGIIEVHGRLDAYNSPNLRAMYDKVCNNAVNFVFDMQNCEFIDSTGLGTIVACLKSASQGGGDIHIANLQSKPRMVFDITRAHKIFHIFDDLDAAVASFDRDWDD